MATKTIRCQSCGAPLQYLTGRCPYCGSFVVEKRDASFSSRDSGAVSFAPRSNIPSSVFAPPPAAPYVPPQQQRPSAPAATHVRKKAVAILLCIFLGWIGVHKAYLGRPGLCVLYILLFAVFSGLGQYFYWSLFVLNPFSFSWSSLIFILVGIDLLYLCLMPQSKFDKRYNKKRGG